MQCRICERVFGQNKGVSHMAQLPAEVKNAIDNYLQALSRNNIPIKEAILFGSYARGNYQEWSDRYCFSF